MKYNMSRIIILFFSLFLGFCSPIYASEVVLTSIGQSPDAMMVKVVMKKMKMSPDTDNLLTAEGLKEKKVLIAVVGGSYKGLEAAGINMDQENRRADELFSTAKEMGIKILVIHVGREGRRGKLSNAFITKAVPFADDLIIVEGANEDGLFNSLIESKDIEIRIAPNVRSTSELLKEVLAGWGIAAN